MNQTKINQAVKDCVREALGQHDPLAALLVSLAQLKDADGWNDSERDIVKKTSLRMLSVIYDADGGEEIEQAETSNENGWHGK